MGKFRQCLTELSARDMIIAGYYRFMFYLSYEVQHGNFPAKSS